MKHNWQHIFNQGTCPSLDVLEKYHEHNLPASEVFEVEHHLASCEICNDLLEGLNAISHPSGLDDAERELRMRLHDYLNIQDKKKIYRISFRAVAIAASLLLIAGLTFFYYQNSTKKQPIIAQVPNAKKPTAPKDTIAIALNQNKDHVTLKPEKANTQNIRRPKSPVSSALADVHNVNHNSRPPDSMASADVALLSPPEEKVAETSQQETTSNIEYNREIPEVVVIGYGTQKKSELTGSVSMVTGKERKGGDKVSQSAYSSDLLLNEIENYIQLKDKDHAIGKLNAFKTSAISSIQKDNADEIIKLLEKDKYEKALRKLKRLN